MMRTSRHVGKSTSMSNSEFVSIAAESSTSLPENQVDINLIFRQTDVDVVEQFC